MIFEISKRKTSYDSKWTTKLEINSIKVKHLLHNCKTAIVNNVENINE